MKTLKVQDWLKEFKPDELLELTEKPIVDQLKFYDTAETGVGFIIYVVPMVNDYGEDINVEQEARPEIQSRPVIKLKGDWYTVDDDNMSDMFRAMLNMLKPE